MLCKYTAEHRLEWSFLHLFHWRDYVYLLHNISRNGPTVKVKCTAGNCWFFYAQSTMTVISGTAGKWPGTINYCGASWQWKVNPFSESEKEYLNRLYYKKQLQLIVLYYREIWVDAPLGSLNVHTVSVENEEQGMHACVLWYIWYCIERCWFFQRVFST